MCKHRICCVFLSLILVISTIEIAHGQEFTGEDYWEQQTDFFEEDSYPIPSDEESITNPNPAEYHDLEYRAVLSEKTINGEDYITQTLALDSASVSDGIQQFKQYINANLPTQYLGSALAINSSITSEFKTAAVKLVTYELKKLEVSINVSGTFNSLAQQVFYEKVGYIQRYNSGKWVYILQGLLYAHGYDPNGFDGSYGVNGGTGCFNAVNSFKRSNLITDANLGDVGLKTMKCLLWAAPLRWYTDGVYYISSSMSGTYLHTQDGGINNGSNVYMYSKYSPNTATVTQLRQLWRICYLGEGYYSIRPMHKPDLALTAQSDGNVALAAGGTSDSMEALSNRQKWYIEADTFGLGSYIKCLAGSNHYLLVENNSTSVGANAYVGNCTTAHRDWIISKVDNPTKGIVIYDTYSQSVVTNPVRWMAPKQMGSISALELTPIFYSEYSIVQNFYWTSSNTACADVVGDTGRITVKGPGHFILRAMRERGEQSYGFQVRVRISEIEEGTYYLRNKSSNKYIDVETWVLNAGNRLVQRVFTGNSTQKWTLDLHPKGGYYYIQSWASILHNMGVQNNSAENNAPVVLCNSENNTGQQWRIAKTTSGSYAIAPVSGNANQCVLALESNSSVNEIGLVQKTFTDNIVYEDEWDFVKLGYELALLGINDSTAGHDHFSCFREVINQMGTFYNLNYHYVDGISLSNCLNMISKSRVFMSRGHGDYTTDSSCLILSNSDSQAVLSSNDIYNFNTRTALVNFNNVELALYVGCYTAKGGRTAQNLVTATVNAGAECAIGFEETVNCQKANLWTEKFALYLRWYNDIEEACRRVQAYVYDQENNTYGNLDTWVLQSRYSTAN